jgi:hypothetical protein
MCEHKAGAGQLANANAPGATQGAPLYPNLAYLAVEEDCIACLNY